MQILKKIALISIVLLLGNGFLKASSLKDRVNFARVESGFISIPDSMQTAVYWYWISDNISKEGAVKDLHAMKKVGINRAFIGNIGHRSNEYGAVKMFSNEWWEILHLALKTATELNIEIGIFNSPGWSQSGGPWVKEEQSMRYLNSSEIKVKGPQKFNSKLVAPNSHFEPFRVIAYKLPDAVGKSYKLLNPKISSQPALEALDNLIDGNPDTYVSFNKNKSVKLNFETAKKATVRSIIIQDAKTKFKAKAELFVKEGSAYRSLKKFEIDRSNFRLEVGFKPNAPIVVAIPETKAQSFQLVLSNINLTDTLAEIQLSEMPLLERYSEKSLAKLHQTPLPYFNDYMWPEQPEIDKKMSISPKDVIDITKYLKADGTLTWSVPKGNWVIMQTGMTTTGVTNGPASPEATGLETDKMSKKHIAAHFDAFLGEIMRRIPAADRKTWKVVVADSYETGAQNWTDGMEVDFEAQYGYNPLKYLPTLNGHVVGSRDQSDRFLWDLRRLVADKISYDYVGGLREVSNKHGLTTWLENYGHWGFPGEFLQYGGQSDEIAGEFWSEGDLGDIENRAASSCAHIYGKVKVSAESFTAGRKEFSRHPANMKQRGDRFFTEGINNTLLHVFIQQPDERKPGMNAWFGNEFNRHNTWFYDMDMFIQYLKRANFMLQQGNYIADAAYFIGEDVPKMTGVCDPALPQGYSFDYINAEVIHTRVSVKNGKLVLPDGMTYSLLVLPNIQTMRPELLAKIKDLVMQGAVVLGPKPTQSPSLQNFPNADAQLTKMADELWGKVDGVNVKSAKVGKGMILSGMEMQEAFDLIGLLPDCKLAKNDSALFIHRSVSDGEIYFISNQTDKTININPEFRVTGKSPEFWSAVDGTKRDLLSYKQTKNTTIVPLKLEAYESQFIVFRKNAKASTALDVNVNFPIGNTIAELNDSWTVSFDKAFGGPKNPVMFKSLTDWTKSDNDSIKYFSGTAVYKRNVQIGQNQLGKKTMLNLGKLTSMAKVKVNGMDVGGAWTAPYQVDISKALKAGDNTIEISVVNNWMNRIIGDLHLPEEERIANASVVTYKKNTPLQASGLFGPVKILGFE